VQNKNKHQNVKQDNRTEVQDNTKYPLTKKKLGVRPGNLKGLVFPVLMGDGHLREKIKLHCGHLSDTISIDSKIYVDN
jgi:hypothetical protein